MPWAPTAVSGSPQLAPDRCTQVLKAWDTKTAGLAKHHRLPSPFPLTGHLSSGKYKSGLSISWVPQVESISGVSNPARPLLVISSLQSISVITSYALMWTLVGGGWFLALASKLFKIIPSYLKTSWKLQFKPFWKIFSFLWSRHHSLSFTEPILWFFAFLQVFGSIQCC